MNGKRRKNQGCGRRNSTVKTLRGTEISHILTQPAGMFESMIVRQQNPVLVGYC